MGCFPQRPRRGDWGRHMARHVVCTALACSLAIGALAGPARKHGLGGIRHYPQPRLSRCAGVHLPRQAHALAAQARALSLRPVIDEPRVAGAATLSAICEGLNARGIAAPRGGKWQAPQVRRLLQSHECWSEALRLGATHVMTHTTPVGAHARYDEEADLIARWNPPMNVHHRTTG